MSGRGAFNQFASDWSRMVHGHACKGKGAGRQEVAESQTDRCAMAEQDPPRQSISGPQSWDRLRLAPAAVSHGHGWGNLDLAPASKSLAKLNKSQIRPQATNH
jgi:hypothetical protein